MNVKLQLDTRQFLKTLAQYGAASKKDLSTIVNSKIKDVMFRASQAAPISDTRKKHKGVDDPPAFVTYLATKKHGQGFKRPQRSAIWARWYNAPTGRGFIRSGFAKAGKAMRAMMDPDNRPAPTPANLGKFINSEGRAVAGSAEWLSRAMCEAAYKGHNASDETNKRVILDRALRSGLRYVIRDMAAYIQRKLAKTAQRAAA